METRGRAISGMTKHAVDIGEVELIVATLEKSLDSQNVLTSI